MNRRQSLQGLEGNSCFLWGPRQVGKTTLLNTLFPEAQFYNLLITDEYRRLLNRPSLFREEVLKLSNDKIVIVDEVQRVPDLLNEVHTLMVETGRQFILCGSSARKLLRGGGNLLGGRALKYRLYPFVSHEIPDFDLIRGINNGMIPRHYLAAQPKKMLESYVGDYLKEEIAAEALTRNIPAFSRFLEIAAFSNGEIVSYQNIATECGVSAPTIKEYFQILEDTLMARLVPSFQKKPKRRVIQAAKFYYFDIGLVNRLLKRPWIEPGSELFGKAFEQFVFQEIAAHSHYSGIDYPLHYWRTASQLEVDFILNNGEIAIEVKGSHEIKNKHLTGLKAFKEEQKPRRTIVVSLDPKPRLMNGIEILPWQIFFEELWAGKIVKG